MEQRLRIEGIYDQRTLKHLKTFGMKDFCFDFSPRSFNFIQEYVFLEHILSQIGPTDRIFLHFLRSNDPMVSKIIEDLNKFKFNMNNVYFEFDEWSEEIKPINFSCNYLLNFSHVIDHAKFIGNNFQGFIFNFKFFEELYNLNLLNNFASNFYTRYHSIVSEKSLMLLKVDWEDNLLTSVFDLFEFNLISLPINSKIEVCYRNVDLKKLSNEMDLLKKNNLISQDF
jgi:hypothetical protein